MKIINNESIPPVRGHYSPAIEHNGVLYVSGQLPVIPHTRDIPEGINAQALLVLQKIEKILLAAGSSRDKVLQVRVYIHDMDLWDDVNSVFADFFGLHKPARCIIPAAKLHFGCLIEAEAVACV
jgi:2-iminobutanoate/2-iminopropanoate deaminase